MRRIIDYDWLISYGLPFMTIVEQALLYVLLFKFFVCHGPYSVSADI